ncbi:hypothetical protein HDZ31DRAFT_65824 [Schizophyllum fasciatum]
MALNRGGAVGVAMLGAVITGTVIMASRDMVNDKRHGSITSNVLDKKASDQNRPDDCDVKEIRDKRVAEHHRSEMLANKGIAVAGAAAAGLAAASMYNSRRQSTDEKVAKSGREQRSPLAQSRSAGAGAGPTKNSNLPELSSHRYG